MDEINATSQLKITLDGKEEILEKEDLLIEGAQMEGYVSNSDQGITVVLDTNLTEELIEEGFVREIISKIQTMRKEAGFEVMDHIKVYEDKNSKIEAIMKKNKKQIESEVLAEEIIFSTPAGYEKEWNLNGENVSLGVEKVEQ